MVSSNNRKLASMQTTRLQKTSFASLVVPSTLANKYEEPYLVKYQLNINTHVALCSSQTTLRDISFKAPKNFVDDKTPILQTQPLGAEYQNPQGSSWESESASFSSNSENLRDNSIQMYLFVVLFLGK